MNLIQKPLIKTGIHYLLKYLLFQYLFFLLFLLEIIMK